MTTQRRPNTVMGLETEYGIWMETAAGETRKVLPFSSRSMYSSRSRVLTARTARVESFFLAP